MAQSNTTNSTRRRLSAGQVVLIGAAFIAGFIVVGALATLAWDYTNSVAFCSNACHAVHPEEPAAFADSYHASVKCTECHMGRLGTLQSIILKASHARHLPEVLFDHWERPLESETMRPANESCEKCHYPPAFHGDRVMEIKRFAADKDNTGRRLYLILKTGGGERSRGLGYGIHWHISNKVEYIATDEHKQDIRWVRSTLPDGRVVEYNDVTRPLTTEEIARLPKRTMDCVDCHNRVGHPFLSPESAVDQALGDGRLSRALPYVKAQMVDLLSASYPDQATALAAVRNLAREYKAKYPDVAAKQSAEIEQAQKLAEELITRVVFTEPGVSWRSFPDNGKHRDFAGCFRCHNGKHLSSSGESIRLHCNICHSIPATTEYNARAPFLPVASIQEPESHLQTNFMADHRFLANESCAQCHGEVTFGTDDSNFCANSACHGQAWPSVELNAAFPHPIPLEGKHAQVWCFSCHQGLKKPVFECSGCHKPPQGHFSGKCDACHAPTGWRESAATKFVHPVKLEGKHASAACSGCHKGTQKPAQDCTACHQPPPQHFTAKCDSCHKPTGWKESAAQSGNVPSRITHTLQGRENCLLCHDPAGNIKPAPANHKGFDVKLCVSCHKPAA